jgi:hypothetical protein
MIWALDRRREGGEHSAKGRTDIISAGEVGGDEKEAGDGRGLLLRVEGGLRRRKGGLKYEARTPSRALRSGWIGFVPDGFMSWLQHLGVRAWPPVWGWVMTHHSNMPGLLHINALSERGGDVDNTRREEGRIYLLCEHKWLDTLYYLGLSLIQIGSGQRVRKLWMPVLQEYRMRAKEGRGSLWCYLDDI